MGSVPQLVAAALAALLLASSGKAEEVFGRPIYNPETKSYFELRDDNTGHTPQSAGPWHNAYRLAAALRYKGAQGRLAVVNTPQTHAFLARNFKIEVEAWIGLRYWCDFKKLQWIDGDLLVAGDFGAWDHSWHRVSYLPCADAGFMKTGFMAVYYTPTERGFRWQAVGASKGFRRYFVEYATGAE